MEELSQTVYTVKLLQQEDIPHIISAFEPTFPFLYQHYLYEQEYDHRCVWVAFKNGSVAGYVTLKWSSNYTYFRTHSIPEIMDLHVLPRFRRQGIGSLLLKQAEEKAAERGSYVGLGVCLYAAYGPAQKLYVNRGYVPDGNGVTYNYEYVVSGNAVPCNEHLVLWLTKKIR